MHVLVFLLSLLSLRTNLNLAVCRGNSPPGRGNGKSFCFLLAVETIPERLSSIKGEPRRWLRKWHLAIDEDKGGKEGEMSATTIWKQAWRAKTLAISELLHSAFRATLCNNRICCKHNLKAFEKKNIFFGKTYLSLRHNDCVRAAKK